MKIYISVDMEGLASINTWKDVNFGDPHYKKKELEEQLKWLVEPIIGHEEVEVVTIADSHALGDNIPYSITELDERIELVSGFPRKRYMMAGLDDTYDRVIFFGYHAGIGALNANMDHTYSSTTFYNVLINGIRMNEALINAAYAGYFGVPVAMIVGDEALKKEMVDFLDRVVYVTTKHGMGRFSAKFVSKKKLERDIKEGVRRAIRKSRDDLRIYRFEPPIELKVETSRTEFADILEMIPGVERLDGRTLKFIHDDYPVVFDTLLLMATLGSMMGRLL
jgi:D-amino peptidase